jgi:hypothetical protein
VSDQVLSQAEIDAMMAAAPPPAPPPPPPVAAAPMPVRAAEPEPEPPAMPIAPRSPSPEPVAEEAAPVSRGRRIDAEEDEEPAAPTHRRIAPRQVAPEAAAPVAKTVVRVAPAAAAPPVSAAPRAIAAVDTGALKAATDRIRKLERSAAVDAAAAARSRRLELEVRTLSNRIDAMQLQIDELERRAGRSRRGVRPRRSLWSTDLYVDKAVSGAWLDRAS